MATATASASVPTSNPPAGMGESDAVYHDLVSFLASPRSDLRKAAAAAALAALADDTHREAARRLASLDAVPLLCKIASEGSEGSEEGGGAVDALAALAMLSADEFVGDQCVLDFVEGGKGVGRMLEVALSSPPTPPSTAASVAALSNEDKEKSKLANEWDGWRKRVNFACALLANATRTEKGAAEFIGLSFPDEAVPSSMMKRSGEEKEAEDERFGKREAKPTAALLLARFLNPAFVDTSSPAQRAAVEAWSKPKLSGGVHPLSSSGDLDDYDSDLDDAALERAEEEGPAPNNDPSSDQHLPKAVDPTTHEGEHYDPYQHVASVLMNVAQLETGRDFLMKLTHSDKKDADEATKDAPTSTSRLQSLLPQLASPNVHRRRGIAGTLKNCCFARDNEWWLLHVVHIDKSLLLPLAGPEELTVDEKVGLDPDYWLAGPTKVREPDALVRLYVVEALLLLLATGRRARETLRERRSYVMLKLADMVEEDERVSERMLECVQYLRRDEDGTDEGSSDRRAYERYARGMIEMDQAKNQAKNQAKALPPSTTAVGDANAEGGEGEDYDGVD